MRRKILPTMNYPCPCPRRIATVLRADPRTQRSHLIGSHLLSAVWPTPSTSVEATRPEPIDGSPAAPVWSRPCQAETWEAGQVSGRLSLYRGGHHSLRQTRQHRQQRSRSRSASTPGTVRPPVSRHRIPAAADRQAPSGNAVSPRSPYTFSKSGPARQTAGSKPSCCARSRSRQIAETRSSASPEGSPRPNTRRRNGETEWPPARPRP